MVRSSPYQGYRIIGPQKQIIYARSMWEANYAWYLQFLVATKEILYWQYEPRTFWFDGIKRGVVSYKPDFFVCTNVLASGYYVEVKGWMDSRSATKIKRFRKYFPDEKLIVVDRKWFARNSSILKKLIPEWESEGKTNIYKKCDIDNIKSEAAILPLSFGPPCLPRALTGGFSQEHVAEFTK